MKFNGLPLELTTCPGYGLAPQGPSLARYLVEFMLTFYRVLPSVIIIQFGRLFR